MNVSVLNNPGMVEDIRTEINTYRRENDNEEVDAATLWDAMKKNGAIQNKCINSHITAKELDEAISKL